MVFLLLFATSIPMAPWPGAVGKDERGRTIQWLSFKHLKIISFSDWASCISVWMTLSSAAFAITIPSAFWSLMNFFSLVSILPRRSRKLILLNLIGTSSIRFCSSEYLLLGEDVMIWMRSFDSKVFNLFFKSRISLMSALSRVP